MNSKFGSAAINHDDDQFISLDGDRKKSTSQRRKSGLEKKTARDYMA